MSFALRMYRRLANAFPHEFKMVYGTEVAELGEEVIEETAREHGVAGLIRLIADIAIRVPLEYLSEIRRDVRYAARGLIKSPGFALVGIVSLGLGMGMTTSVFSRLWVEMFRDLPGAAHASELATAQAPVSYYYVDQYREQKSLFAGVAAFQQGVPFNVSFQGSESAKPQRVFGQLVSADYFSVLGVRPQRGRMLDPRLDRPGDSPVVVISDRFWRDRLNSSPDAVGQVLRLNGRAATIVGIASKDFNGALPINPAELFVPVTVPAALAPELANGVLLKRDAKAFLPMFRLAPGVGMEAAEAGLDTVTRNLDAQDSSIARRDDKGRRVILMEGGRQAPIPRNLKPVVVAFMFVLIGLILSIACLNLANMLMARGVARKKELAIRLATGASRFRLIRQMITEGVLLSVLSGVAGVAFAYWSLAMSSRFRTPSVVPIELGTGLDWDAVLFTFGLAVLCGIGFSLVPALQATRADVATSLKEGSVTQLRGYRRFGLRNLLMVGQVAGSLMLLLITGFLVIGFNTANQVQTRFDLNRMILLSIDPVRDGYSPEKAQAFFEKLPARLRAVPGVSSIALAAQPPFSVLATSTQLSAAGDSRRAAALAKSVSTDKIGAGYFAALNERVIAGREFEERDERIPADESKAVSLPVLLNESAAHALFADGSAVGKRVNCGEGTCDVIGVVPDLTNGVLADNDTSSTMYVPLTQRDFASPPPGGVTIMARFDGGADALRMEREIAALDPALAVFNVKTLSEQLELGRSMVRLSLDTYSAIGLFGLILSAIGLAGVTAYAVARRRKEIGIRMALGARKSQVLRLVLREGAALVAVGTVLGFLGAVAVVRVLSSVAQLFADALNVSTSDLRLLLGAPLLLAAIAMLACYLPARRSATIDPLKALRQVTVPRHR